ncbi:MAG: hypothetical protein ACLFPU_10260 [Dehalococcoidia bacterium]
MTSICFVGTYSPIMCGIADYTGFLTRESPLSRCGVLSFDLKRSGLSLTKDHAPSQEPVWYGIPGRYHYSASDILNGLQTLGMNSSDTVLWFQHEFGIWANSGLFARMIKNLNLPKIVTFHTLHFQSHETRYGLEKRENELLQQVLPYVDAITVFSRGVHHAVTSAFPHYRDKIYVTKHGVHVYPQVSQLSREAAKEKLNDFLLYDSDLDRDTKEMLHMQRVFLAPDTIVIGQTGFLCSQKQSETLYEVRDSLQELIPDKRIVAVRIGDPRDEFGKIYARHLRKEHNGRDKFLLQTWLPQHMLPVAQRAFDVNFYWPTDCTQSGVLAHALGADAIIAGRDLEGVGETLKEAGELAHKDLRHLKADMVEIIRNPEFCEKIENNVLKYAREFSWSSQSRRHYELADKVLSSSIASALSHRYLRANVETYPSNRTGGTHHINPGMDIRSSSFRNSQGGMTGGTRIH